MRECRTPRGKLTLDDYLFSGTRSRDSPVSVPSPRVGDPVVSSVPKCHNGKGPTFLGSQPRSYPLLSTHLGPCCLTPRTPIDRWWERKGEGVGTTKSSLSSTKP